MGVTNYLIEGVSGAGKTSVAEELERRGFHVVHGDRNFAYYGDPDTGAPLDWPAFDDEAARIAWGYAHWIWPVARVEAIIADLSVPVTFFCGGTRNSHQFIDRFDGVFVLEVDAKRSQRGCDDGRTTSLAGGRSSASWCCGCTPATQGCQPRRRESTPRGQSAPWSTPFLRGAKGGAEFACRHRPVYIRHNRCITGAGLPQGKLHELDRQRSAAQNPVVSQ